MVCPNIKNSIGCDVWPMKYGTFLDHNMPIIKNIFVFSENINCKGL